MTTATPSKLWLTSGLQSLSRAQSCKNRAPSSGLEHISEALARFLATLDRQQLGKILEQGGGEDLCDLGESQGQSPPLVTTSYPNGGGV